MKKEKILVSACLLKDNCKADNNSVTITTRTATTGTERPDEQGQCRAVAQCGHPEREGHAATDEEGHATASEKECAEELVMLLTFRKE